MFPFVVFLLLPPTTYAQSCPSPAQGCVNGLWSVEKCVCECIPPFCHNSELECLQTGCTSEGNPWGDCIPGSNCPWWVDSSRPESCATGYEVPKGTWEIFPSRRWVIEWPSIAHLIITIYQLISLPQYVLQCESSRINWVQSCRWKYNNWGGTNLR